MLKNFLVIAFRNLLKHKSYTLINIIGLAVGLAACILILLYVQDELSYDRQHPNVDRLYRVTLRGQLAGNRIHTSNTCPPMAAALLQEFPEVEAVTRIDAITQPIMVTAGNGVQFNEDRVIYGDSTLFDLFSITVLKGDPRTALSRPNTMVITESTARKYFGDEDAIGKTLTLDNRTDFLVTAVIKDIPGNMHFKFDLMPAFITFESSRRPLWLNNFIATYLRLKENVSAATFEPKLQELVLKYVGPEIQKVMGVSVEEFYKNGGDYRYALQPVTDIHLNTDIADNIEPSSNPAYVTIFTLVAVFVLILACINFMNLATAKSANRAKEVGIRKVVGSLKKQLVRQFMIEAFLLSLIALLFSILLVMLALPEFNTLAGKQVELDFASNFYLLPGLLMLTLVVGFLAGAYPAFFLAKFKPVEVLKGKFGSGMKSSSLRSGLVIFQFSISIILLVGTFVVGDQLKYVREKQLGFDKEHLLVVKRAAALGSAMQAFQDDLQRLPSVLSSAAARQLPGRSTDQKVYKPEGTSSEQGYILNSLSVSYGFVETMGMELVEGRDFSREFPGDSAAYILNEAALKRFGWEKGVGKLIYEPGPDEMESGPVIGVVKDFHYESLHNAIEPAIMRFRSRMRHVAIRLQGHDLQESLHQIEKIWNAHAAGQPFEYSFLNEDFDALYRADQRAGKLFTLFSTFGTLIACLGLFGLASFSAEQRTKEIGVRKVLGASVPNIIMLLSKEFTKLVIVASFVAMPIGYYAMTQWLQNFAYRTSVGADTFLMAGCAALTIALLTVSFQSTKAALTNPAQALKYE